MVLYNFHDNDDHKQKENHNYYCNFKNNSHENEETFDFIKKDKVFVFCSCLSSLSHQKKSSQNLSFLYFSSVVLGFALCLVSSSSFLN